MFHADLIRRLDELDGRVAQVEERLNAVEVNIEQTLNRFGDYKNRTREDLIGIQGQLGTVIATLESLVADRENRVGIERARALLKRARNNNSRVAAVLRVGA